MKAAVWTRFVCVSLFSFFCCCQCPLCKSFSRGVGGGGIILARYWFEYVSILLFVCCCCCCFSPSAIAFASTPTLWQRILLYWSIGSTMDRVECCRPVRAPPRGVDKRTRRRISFQWKPNERLLQRTVVRFTTDVGLSSNLSNCWPKLLLVVKQKKINSTSVTGSSCRDWPKRSNRMKPSPVVQKPVKKTGNNRHYTETSKEARSNRRWESTRTTHKSVNLGWNGYNEDNIDNKVHWL